jgi:signal transduction histidine kinase
MHWPRSLHGRVAAILLAGLGVAYGLSLWSAMRGRAQMADALMLEYVGRDVASSVALLDRLPASERAQWLDRLARPNYHFLLEAPAAATTAASAAPAPLSAALASSLADRLGAGRVQTVSAAGPDGTAFALRLGDGTPLTLLSQPPVRSLQTEAVLQWLLQAAAVGLGVVLAVRVATRPLSRLADAAQRLGEDPSAAPVDEHGPVEVRRAAAALNAMRQRIAEHMNERLQILAAVSHDLRAPITRMRVRCDLLPDGTVRGKLQADLDEMQHLVEEGLALASSDHAASEADCSVDLHALLDAIVCDFTDAGHTVQWSGEPGLVLTTRPQALRRVVVNLLDNSIKFAGAAELQVEASDGIVTIGVLDRGPGIAPARMAEVMRPFSRLEPSRSRESGGTGLGLAIAQRLCTALGASLRLMPRDGGGLHAELKLATRG